MTAITDDTNWKLQAACRGMDTEIFFSDKPKSRRKAQETCASCPVSEACLAAVLRAEEGTGAHLRDGIFAGLNGRQRHAIAVPRKHRKKSKVRAAG
ncbi:WhiB family transcriptional regulator [Streptomyces sp. CA-288835]|uniref:WhiB family transcriptional regulator n=1 Tax=Streptomyces sp. CA-288835 TaxID=3240069 RepID=UPI003D943350